MTTEQLAAATDLDLRIQRKAGRYHVEARTVDLAGEGASLGEAVRAILGPAADEVKALGPIEARGILMAPGVRRLARLGALLPLLGQLAGEPTK